MKLITFSGPPSCGKTVVILKLCRLWQGRLTPGVIKFDCLSSSDAALYRHQGIPVQTGISGSLCPDHFYASNIGACIQWAARNNIDPLLVESAGLCNRCAPHLREAVAVCVIDLLAGMHAPQKIGPMLKLADIIIITKGDIVSQAEREVFALRTVRANPRAKIFFVNGLTGQGIFAVNTALSELLSEQAGEVRHLRFSMPAAVCSYCFGETNIQLKHISGNIKTMKFTDDKGC